MPFLALAALAATLPAPFGQMTEVWPGHRVHLHCEGPGPATVLILHGTPRFSFHYTLVQQAAARMARVCVYDRAGDAWTDPVAGQPTAEIFVRELDAVIRHLAPRGEPVVLVGHSIGGVLARAYYALHPERVRAMILVDTQPAEAVKFSVHPAARPAAAPVQKLPARFLQAHQWATERWHRYADAVPPDHARRYQADLFRLAGLARSATLPVWILYRGGSPAWEARQKRMAAAAWGAARLRTAPGAGHDIELDQPDAVAAAISEAVAAAR
ncbi:MAG: alpha/beta hydrolase [Bryobacterales bacterium]|nr:alpha/beta hydrolase [Bryobacterales bacterium]